MAYNQQMYYPGMYTLTDGCVVTQTGDKNSARIGGVDKGQVHQVMEICNIPGQYRIRGRIANGWITLKDTSSNKTWVQGTGTPAPSQNQHGFVQTHHGKYIMVSPQRQVTGNSTNKKGWEQLRITPIHGGRVQIMSSHNTYLGAKPDGAVYAEGHCKEWEMWFQERRGDRFALRSHHGQYLTADQQGNLRTKQCQVQDWELFRMHPMQQNAGVGSNFIRSHHGKYVMVDQNSKQIHARSGNMKEWETITIQAVGGGRYTLRSYHNTFVGAEPNGRVYGDRPQPKDWEFWYMENRGGRYAFKSHHGQYLTADQNGSLRTKQCQAQDWELFTLTPTGVGAMTQQMGQMNMGQQAYVPPPVQQPYAPQQQPYAPQQQPYAPQGQQPLPQGSWIQSARNQRMQGNVLYCELNNGRGQFVQASVICYPGQRFKNAFGQFQPE